MLTPSPSPSLSLLSPSPFPPLPLTPLSSSPSPSPADWVDTTDPNVKAETELLHAAASIEAAAKKLAELKPRASTVRPHSLTCPKLHLHNDQSCLISMPYNRI